MFFFSANNCPLFLPESCHYKSKAFSKSPFPTQQPVHIVYSRINSQSMWQKCKWYKFWIINDKSLTASTSCTSPGSLITEHGSSILSLKKENQSKFPIREKWAIDCFRMLLPRPSNLYRYSPIDSLFLLLFECLHIPAPRSKGKSTKPDEKQIGLCKHESSQKF